MGFINNLSRNERIFIFMVVVLALLLMLLTLLDYNWKNNYEEEQKVLSEKYQIDESKDEYLVQCTDGSYDVYKPQETLFKVCGQIVTTNVS